MIYISCVILGLFLAGTPVNAELSSLFAHVDVSGNIIAVQTLTPPLDLSRAVPPSGERLIDISRESVREAIMAQPNAWQYTGGVWRPIVVVTPTPPLADLTGKDPASWTIGDVARALRFLLQRQGQ